MTFVCPDCGSDDIGGKGPEWACGDCGEVFDAPAERREKEDGMSRTDFQGMRQEEEKERNFSRGQTFRHESA